MSSIWTAFIQSHHQTQLFIMVVITTTIVFILNKFFLFPGFLDIYKRVIVLVVRVLFKAKYETSFS